MRQAIEDGIIMVEMQIMLKKKLKKQKNVKVDEKC